jgi:hypothetical protein
VQVSVHTVPAAASFYVILGLEGEYDSGGHIENFHGGQRPSGSLDNSAGYTAEDGVFSATFTAPLFGENVTVRAGLGSAAATIVVRVPGLEELEPYSEYNRNGELLWHPHNHYATPATNTGLMSIAHVFYWNNASHDKVTFNDASLPNGGLFELTHDWGTNGHHSNHSEGTACDVPSALINTTRWSELKQLFSFYANSFGDETNTTSPHWHVRFY